jgi:hypothetical protein
MAPSENFLNTHLAYFILSSLKPLRWGSAIRGLFNRGVWASPIWITLLSEFYKGSSLTLSIDFLILAILYSPRSSQGKIIRLFSLKHRVWISTLPPPPRSLQGYSLKRTYKLTSHNIILPRSSQGKTIRLFSLKHRACISMLLCITLT